MREGTALCACPALLAYAQGSVPCPLRLSCVLRCLPLNCSSFSVIGCSCSRAPPGRGPVCASSRGAEIVDYSTCPSSLDGYARPQCYGCTMGHARALLLGVRAVAMRTCPLGGIGKQWSDNNRGEVVV